MRSRPRNDAGGGGVTQGWVERAGAPPSLNPHPSRRSAAPRQHRPAGATATKSVRDVRRMGMRGVGHAAKVEARGVGHRAIVKVLRGHSRLWRSRAPANTATRVRRRLLRCVLQWPRHGVRDSAACHPERVLQSVRWRLADAPRRRHGMWMVAQTSGLRTPARGKKRRPRCLGQTMQFPNEDECQGVTPWHSCKQPTEIPETASFPTTTPNITHTTTKT